MKGFLWKATGGIPTFAVFSLFIFANVESFFSLNPTIVFGLIYLLTKRATLSYQNVDYTKYMFMVFIRRIANGIFVFLWVLCVCGFVFFFFRLIKLYLRINKRSKCVICTYIFPFGFVVLEMLLITNSSIDHCMHLVLEFDITCLVMILAVNIAAGKMLRALS